MGEGKLEALLASAVDAILTIDRNGIIEQANPAASRLFGHAPDAFAGRNVSFLMPEPWASRHDGFLRRYQRTGENRIIGIGREVEGLRTDGTTFPMHLAVSEFEAEGEVRYTGIIHDLTRRKKAEDALMQAQKMESIGQLTGGIAHDFNNLLTVITGNLELLEMQLDDEGQRALLREASDAAELGADLTNRLLAFARRSLLEPRVFHPNEMLQEIGALLRRTVGGNVAFEMRLAPNLWSTRADPGQLESVILNLAVNARDAMPVGGRLVIETRNAELDRDFAADELGVLAGDYVCITVSDTGEGMAPDILARAFEPFFTTKAQGRGTGLGLSMVHGFAQQSAGKAAIYSELGIGTSVSVYLPRHLEDESTEAARGGLGAAALPRGRSETILVVEDDDSVRKVTIQRLVALGYRPVAVDGANAALVVLEERADIALVFSDLVMPGGPTGLDLARKVSGMRPQLPVLLTSGYAEGLIAASEPLEFSLLRKPYRQEELARTIREALDRRED